MSWDAIIVGSGFGGSVTAAHLARKGMKVLVLERGPWWGPGGEGQPAPRRRPLPRGAGLATHSLRGVRVARGRRGAALTLNKAGMFELHLFDHLAVAGVSGVGGGSLVYTAILSEPEKEWFGAFPPEITAAAMKPYFNKVRKVMQPAPIPALPEKNEVFANAAKASGLGEARYPQLAVAWGDPKNPKSFTNAAGVEQHTCDWCGECILGCPQKAKGSMDLTYLPMALKAGATLKPLCEVTAIGRAGNQYVVRWRDGATGKRHRATAPRLVVAAGTLNTLRLLFEGRQNGLDKLSPMLGKKVSPNGDMGAAILGARALRDASQGPAFNAYLQQPGDGPLRYVVGEVGLPLGALGLPPAARRLLGGHALLLTMGRDTGEGEMTFDDGFLHTGMGREVGDGLFDAMEDTVAQLAQPYRPLMVYSNAPAGRGGRFLATGHLMGGARIARGPKEGVVDHTGQVFGHKGLYVADGSLYPTPPGLPPSLTIAALAQRQAELMAG